MTAAGVIPIAAVGNDGQPKKIPEWIYEEDNEFWPVCNPVASGNTSSPANSPDCIGIGAVGWTEEASKPKDLDLYQAGGLFDSEGSSRGKASGAGSLRKPDLVAPGVDVFMAFPGPTYVLNTGTSFAAPRVAGIVALMLQSSESLRSQPGRDRFLSVRGALGELATECASVTGNSFPYGCYTPCPNQYYGTGVLHDSLAMWNLARADWFPGFQLDWRTVRGDVADTLGREIDQATVLLNTGQRVVTDGIGAYSVIAETGVWNGYAWSDRIDTVTVLRPPYPAVMDTVMLKPAPNPPVIPQVIEDFVLNGSGILQVSGYVRDLFGAGIEGVSVTGFPIGEVWTDENGYYRDFVPSGWTGTLKPAAPGGDLFLPDSLVFQTPVTSGLEGQNFTINARRVAGLITSAIPPLGPGEGFVVDAIEDGSSEPTSTDMTDATGSYEMALPTGWAGTVQPRFRGLYNEFSPSSYHETIGSQHLSARNFTGTHRTTEWLEGGLPVCERSTPERFTAIVPDGSSGAIMAFGDGYVQKVLENGDLRWTRDGFELLRAASCSASDANGGVLVAGGESGHVYAQRIGRQEETLWGAGNELGHLGSLGGEIAILGDGSGGAYVSWIDGSSAIHPFPVYLTRVQANGVVAWPVPVSVGPGFSNWGEGTSLVSDGAGGVILCWEDWDGTPGDGVDLYAQRIDSVGTVQWGTGGVLVKNTGSPEAAHHASLADGAHGVFVVWNDQYTTYRAQRIDAQGTKLWASAGVAVGAQGTSFADRAAVASDGSGGVIVACRNMGTWYGIVLQRISAQGTVQWGANGVTLYEGLGSGFPRLVSDGMGGVIVTWSCDIPALELKAQRLGPEGQTLWNSSGIEITSSLSHEMDHGMAPDGAHGAIVAWADDRSGDGDIYAQRIGEAAVPADLRACLKAPDTLIVLPDTFVVGCPAGNADTLVVEIDFDDSMPRDIAAEELTLGDPVGSNILFHWRTPPIADGPASAPDFRTTISQPFISGCSGELGDSVPVLLNGSLIGFAAAKVKSPDLDASGNIGLLDLALFSAAYDTAHNCPNDPGYNACADYRDGGAQACVMLPDLSIFASHYGCFYQTQGGQGASAEMDSRQTTAVVLEPRESNWKRPGDDTSFKLCLEDAKKIKLMGMVIALADGLEFVKFTACVGFENRLFVGPKAGHLKELSVILLGGPPIEGDADIGTIEFRSMTAPSVEQLTILVGESLLEDGTIGALGGPLAAAVAEVEMVYENSLGWNHPNPFNPGTTIEYSIAKDSHVRLAIYNVKGQLVRTLVDDDLPRGSHSVLWDATNNAGSPVVSGVYWYKLETPYFSDTKKLTILR
jgi:hypothetical protein